MAYLKEISGHSCRRINKFTKISEELIIRQGFEGSAFGTEICIWGYVHLTSLVSDSAKYTPCTNVKRMEKIMERDIRGLRVFEVSAVTKLNKTFLDRSRYFQMHLKRISTLGYFIALGCFALFNDSFHN